MLGWKPGERIGNYQIVGLLKSGGMGSLFVAQRLGVAGFARPVALKVIHPHLAQDPRFVRMFVDEAKLSAHIDHPNVVHVEELGEHEGTWFLAMELVHGVALSQLLRVLGTRGRRLAPEIAVAIALQVADGLEAAHQARDAVGESLAVVHRDVSPQNVLVAFKGHVKLIDFGIAKARGRTQHSATGTIRGKFRYMSPEQALARAVDPRTDVYALGIVLWEMLTGRRRFDAATDVELLDRVRAPDVVAPSTWAHELPPALDAVVLDATHADPARRIASAAALRARLIEALPSARSVGPDEVSHLVVGALPDAFESSRTLLMACAPAIAVTELPSHDTTAHDPRARGQSAGDEALATYTVAGDTLLPDDDDDSGELPAIAPPLRSRAETPAMRRRGFALAMLGGLAVCAGVVLAVNRSGGSHPAPGVHAVPAPSPAVAPVITPPAVALVVAPPAVPIAPPPHGHPRARTASHRTRAHPVVQRFGHGGNEVPVATELAP